MTESPRRQVFVSTDGDGRLALAGAPGPGDTLDYLALPGEPDVPHAMAATAGFVRNQSSLTSESPVHAPRRFQIDIHILETRDGTTDLPEGVRLWSAQDALREWERQRALLSPLARTFIERICHQEALDAPLDTEPPRLSEALAGIRQLPLETPTLPPARHTNAYVVGEERLVVVDPATYEDNEQARLFEVIDELLEQGAEIDCVVLTHHHPDHVGAATPVSSRYGVPIAADPKTRDLLEGVVAVTRVLNEGDRIDLGVDATGERFELEVLQTPGHAPGHIVLVDRRSNTSAMIVGDMVAAIGTIIIDPPEGNMAEYVAQLERLAAMKPRLVYPAHGPLVVDGTAKLEHYVRHRLAREAKVLGALELESSPALPEALLPRAYDDTPEALYPLAARSCLAHLEKLVVEGRAQRIDGRYVVADQG